MATGLYILNFRFGRRTYDSVTNRLGSVVWTNCGPVIPAGTTGYFCMDPALTPEANRNWLARDEISLQFESSGNFGILRDTTVAVMYEITEEFILDNDFDTRPGNRPPL